MKSNDVGKLKERSIQNWRRLRVGGWNLSSYVCCYSLAYLILTTVRSTIIHSCSNNHLLWVIVCSPMFVRIPCIDQSKMDRFGGCESVIDRHLHLRLLNECMCHPRAFTRSDDRISYNYLPVLQRFTPKTFMGQNLNGACLGEIHMGAKSSYVRTVAAPTNGGKI